MSHFRVCNNGSLLQSFLYAFRRGAGPCSQWRGVCNSEVSAGRELIVGVLELRVNSMVKSFPLSFINLPSVNLQLQQEKGSLHAGRRQSKLPFFIQSSFGYVYRAHLKENFEIQHLLSEWIGERS